MNKILRMDFPFKSKEDEKAGGFARIPNFKDIEFDLTKTVCFTGPRPKSLKGGYNIYSKDNIELGREIRDKVVKLINEGYDSFISGTALGVDTIAFMVVDKIKRENPELGIKNYLFYPYHNQGSNWQEEDIKRLKENKDKSDGYVYTEAFHPAGYPNYSRSISPGMLLQFRNEMMVDYSSAIIAIYTDGYTGGTKNCVDYAKKKEKRIEVVDVKNFLK